MRLEPGDLLVDRYQLRNVIGGGGFAQVWRASDTKARGRDIAIKIYSPNNPLSEEGIEQFRQEYVIAGQLIHSNIVVPNHYDIHDGAPFMIMPFMPNGTADKYVDDWNDYEVERFLKSISSALEHIHTLQHPVVHQDIKPKNILVNEDGEFMLADFGISKEFKDTLRKSVGGKSEDGGMTIAFAPPEKFAKDLNARKPRPSNDIWSLGATIFYLITGELPFGESGGIVQLNGAQVPTISEPIGKKLKSLITWMLHPDANERPTASEVLEYIANGPKSGLDFKMGYFTIVIPVLAIVLDHLFSPFLTDLAKIILISFTGIGVLIWIGQMIKNRSLATSYFHVPFQLETVKWYDWLLSLGTSLVILLKFIL